MTMIRCMASINKLAQAKYAKSAMEILQVKCEMPAPALSQEQGG